LKNPADDVGCRWVVNPVVADNVAGHKFCLLR
jgi:hypothetical protein